MEELASPLRVADDECTVCDDRVDSCRGEHVRGGMHVHDRFDFEVEICEDEVCIDPHDVISILYPSSTNIQCFQEYFHLIFILEIMAMVMGLLSNLTPLWIKFIVIEAIGIDQN